MRRRSDTFIPSIGKNLPWLGIWALCTRMRFMIASNRATAVDRLLLVLLPAWGCGNSNPGGGGLFPDATVGHYDALEQADATAFTEANIPDVNRGEAPGPMKNFCDLPGSVVWSNGSPQVVP